MTRLLPHFVCLVALAPLAVALDPYTPPRKGSVDAKPLTPQGIEKAMELLMSPSSAVRMKAMDALRMRANTEETRKQVREIFEKAKAAHLKGAEAVVKKGSPGLSKIQEAYAAWETKRTDVLSLIRTDYHKDPEKVAMLSREHAATAELQGELAKALKSAEAAWKPLAATTIPLEEMDHELALMDRSSYAPKNAEDYLKQLGAAQEFVSIFTLVKKCQQATDQLAAVEAHNAAVKGAPKTAVMFATILNQRRYVVGLEPLRLDERLDEAAQGHSQEMVALGYFAHESPVPANKTPGDRARNAKFEGSWAGECIFVGSAAPEAAYSGWWGSDGHRFIMFASGPNTLGMGPVGNHWTLMTGNKNWGRVATR